MPATASTLSIPPDALGIRLFQALAAAGARAVFGVPGDFALPLYNVLRLTRVLPLVDLAHEPSAAFAADAAARHDRVPGVCLFTFGAGTLNAINPVAAAWAEHVPLVVISGAPGYAERHGNLLVHHQVRDCDSQRRMLAEITVDHAVLDDPQTAPAAIARVLGRCIAESRPVYFEVPRDVALVPCDAVRPLPTPPLDDAQQLAVAVSAVAERARAARRGIILVDVGVRRFGLEPECRRIANALGWPVHTTFMGRGVLADPMYGPPPVWSGAAGTDAERTIFAQADCIIGLGIIHSDTNHAGAPSLRSDARYVDIHANGVTAAGVDIEVSMRGLVPSLATRLETAQVAVGPAIVATASHRARPSEPIADDAPPTPDDIAAAVDFALATHPDTPVISDVGDCLFAASAIACRDFLASGYYATMGYGIPAAIGVQATSGRRPVVLVGDGAFQMGGLELGRCRPNGWSPIVIVFDNGQWEMVRSFDPGGQTQAQPPIDYATLAVALGCVGHRVTTRAGLAVALADAFANAGRAHVVHVQLRPNTISHAMARFIAAFQRARDGHPLRFRRSPTMVGQASVGEVGRVEYAIDLGPEVDDVVDATLQHIGCK